MPTGGRGARRKRRRARHYTVVVSNDVFRSRKCGRLGQREGGHQIQLHDRIAGQRRVRFSVAGREDCADGEGNIHGRQVRGQIVSEN